MCFIELGYENILLSWVQEGQETRSKISQKRAKKIQKDSEKKCNQKAGVGIHSNQNYEVDYYSLIQKHSTQIP